MIRTLALTAFVAVAAPAVAALVFVYRRSTDAFARVRPMRPVGLDTSPDGGAVQVNSWGEVRA